MAKKKKNGTQFCVVENINQFIKNVHVLFGGDFFPISLIEMSFFFNRFIEHNNISIEYCLFWFCFFNRPILYTFFYL